MKIFNSLLKLSLDILVGKAEIDKNLLKTPFCEFLITDIIESSLNPMTKIGLPGSYLSLNNLRECWST